MHRLDVAAYRLSPVRHRAVHPDANFYRRTAGNIAAEIRWNFNGDGQFAVAHPPVQLVIALQRRLLNEVARTGDILRPGLTAESLVAIEDREAQIFHIHTNAISHDEHQNHGTQQRQSRTYRIAPQLQRFTSAVAKQSSQAERLARGRRSGGRVNRRGGRYLFDGPLGILQPGDKRLFKVRRAALRNQRLRRVAGQYLPGVH